MDDSLRQDLRAVRVAALEVHGALVTIERLAHEREHGRVGTPAQLLELVMHDARFAWLHQLSELIVAFDQMLELPELSHDDAAAMRHEVEAVLSSQDQGFAPKYLAALQEPDAFIANVKLRRAFSALPDPAHPDAAAEARARWTAPKRRG